MEKGRELGEQNTAANHWCFLNGPDLIILVASFVENNTCALSHMAHLICFHVSCGWGFLGGGGGDVFERKKSPVPVWTSFLSSWQLLSKLENICWFTVGGLKRFGVAASECVEYSAKLFRVAFPSYGTVTFFSWWQNYFTFGVFVWKKQISTTSTLPTVTVGKKELGRRIEHLCSLSFESYVCSKRVWELLIWMMTEVAPFLVKTKGHWACCCCLACVCVCVWPHPKLRQTANMHTFFGLKCMNKEQQSLLDLMSPTNYVCGTFVSRFLNFTAVTEKISLFRTSLGHTNMPSLKQNTLMDQKYTFILLL